jgi:hypothetical protein
VILFEICNGEAHDVYQTLEVENGSRQYDFLRSIVGASLAVERPFLSGHVIKALNFQAIACLHGFAGEYRPCAVDVGTYRPPEHYRVDGLMEDFINQVNRAWEKADAVALAAFVLWRLNHIHPFINGNGRTARAASYFVLCVKVGQWLPGTTILPELLRRNRPRYVEALQKVDASAASGSLDLGALHALIAELLAEQINGSTSPGDAGVATAPNPDTPNGDK